MKWRQSKDAQGLLQFEFEDESLFDSVAKYLIHEAGAKVVRCLEDGITNEEIWMDVEIGSVHLTLHWHYFAGLFLRAGDKHSEAFLLGIAQALAQR